MRHLVVILAVIYAVIGDGWAQNRGSSRYVPPEDFEGDITRAPRPTRGSNVRRQRPTKAPESPVVEELKPYEPPESPARTTARRIPERGTSQQIASPHAPSLPVDDSVSHFASPAQGLHEASPAGPEGRQHGTRRRRPKKRRRPQNAIPKSVEEPNKQIAADEEKSSITDLLNEDKKRTGVFQNNPIPRNSPSAYSSESDYSAEKSTWENNHPSEQQNNAAGSPYYRPQAPSNRLPEGNSEPVGNSRSYSAPSLAGPAGDVSRPQSSLPNDGSYIPVLSPIRVPSEGASRLPPENYPAVRGKETAGLSSDPNTFHRGHSNRPPVANPDDITGAKPVHNIIPQSDESPLSGHSEVRLLEEDKPLISSQYVPPRFDSPEHLLTSNPKVSEDTKESPSASNRLPNPSEIHYDSIYPEYSNAQPDGSQRIAGRRQEPEETPVGSPITSYSVPRRNSGTKPQEYDNDAEVDRRQVSQYRPPLQRAGSRYKTEDSDKQPRTRVQEQPPTRVVTRTRGSSRHQQPTVENTPERTRGLTRSNSDAPANSSPRAGSSSVPRSTVGTRGSQRYVPNTVETAPRNPTEEASYVDHGNPELLSSSIHSQPSARSLGDLGSLGNTLRSHPQSEAHNEPSASSLGDSGSIRNTLRSHPQSEIHSSPANSGDSGSIRNTLRSRPQSAVHNQPPANSGDSGSIRNTLRSRPQSAVHNQPPANSGDSGSVRNTLRSRPQSEVPSQPPASFRSVSETGSIRNTLRSHPQSEVPNPPQASFRSVSETGSIRNTLRSRPQYEVPDSEHSDSYEESVEDLNTYNTDYQLPQQTNPRVIPNQRTPVPKQQPPQSAYQSPANRLHGRQDSHYEPPQNPRSRQQPQYEAPHNPRVDSRQAQGRQNPSTSRQQSRSRQSNEPPQHPRSSTGGSNFKCPDSFGFFADPVQCDKYYECRNGTAEMHLCNDGLAFNEISAPKFLRCDSLRDVDCKSRPELQEPQPTENCPRKFGLFAHQTDCTKFWNCVDGTASEVQCPPGLTYNDDRATCDWADLVETSATTCKSEDLLGFTCPEPTTHDLLDGVYARYPHPDNCQLHFTCIKGADGLRRPRMLSCNEGLVFDPETSACKRPEEVPGCEDFYGGRSQAPKKKPARQPPRREPEPEPEEIAEEPTPRPRRRGSNRRVRY